jgi:hypothetical protein
MINKLLRDHATRFVAAEQIAIPFGMRTAASWKRGEKADGDYCPVNKREDQALIKDELSRLIAQVT